MNKDEFIEVKDLLEIEQGDAILIKTKGSKYMKSNYYWVVISSVQNNRILDGDFIILEKINIVDVDGLDDTKYQKSVYTNKLIRVYYSDIVKVYVTNAVKNIEDAEPDDE